MTNPKKAVLPIILLFIFINAFLLIAKPLFTKHGIDREVVMVANIICFLLHIGTFLLQSKSLKSRNPNAFVRAAMAGIMMKMLMAMIGVLIYIKTTTTLNKPAIYVSMFIYLIYMIVELAVILKLNKQKNA